MQRQLSTRLQQTRLNDAGRPSYLARDVRRIPHELLQLLRQGRPTHDREFAQHEIMQHLRRWRHLLCVGGEANACSQERALSPALLRLWNSRGRSLLLVAANRLRVNDDARSSVGLYCYYISRSRLPFVALHFVYARVPDYSCKPIGYYNQHITWLSTVILQSLLATHWPRLVQSIPCPNTIDLASTRVVPNHA